VFSKIVWRNRRKVPATAVRVEDRSTVKDRLPRNSCRQFVVCSWHEQLPDVIGMRPQRTTTSAVTYESLNLGSSPAVCRSVFRMSKSSLYIEVIRSRSRLLLWLWPCRYMSCSGSVFWMLSRNLSRYIFWISRSVSYLKVIRSRPMSQCRRTWLRTIGDRSFRVTAAHAWNSLPTSVTTATSLASFKRQQKTFLFTKSFPEF